MTQTPVEHAADMVSREEYEQLQANLNASQGKVAELEQQVNALQEALRLAQAKFSELRQIMLDVYDWERNVG